VRKGENSAPARLVACDRLPLAKLSDQRFHWINAPTAALDQDEMRELIIDAWRMVGPKRVAAAHLGHVIN
jgi:hypothetical protein